jgi:CRISPR/Cas system-associated exonuclease Cas4 (RecB family)
MKRSSNPQTLPMKHPSSVWQRKRRAREHPWAGLPLVLLDVNLESRAHRTFVNALAEQSAAVFAALRPGEAMIEALAAANVRKLDEGPAKTPLDHLRRNLFAESPETFPSPEESFELFSAPGGGLEAVEIARRMLRLAEAGFRFDAMAILLRHPDRYQPVVEDALLRARIPAFFSRGTRRPNPSGRAFLALLGCGAENLSASRFAEYLSLEQVPEFAPPARWIPPEDELLGVEEQPAPEQEPPAEAARPAPRRWEQFLVDAAVIGGLDRWKRRLDGLQAEWHLQGRDDPELFHHLDNLRRFALPLIGALASLPKAALWSEWLHHLTDLARRSLRDPDGVLAMLAELAPMGDVGPATLEEVIEVLSERLRFLRREPPARRWGRVFVGSIEEARARSFRVVFLPGLAEGMFPQRPLEDPLLLDEARRAIDKHLPLRGDKVGEERLRLQLAVGATEARLVVSYPRMEVAEARPRVPSFYALELPRALEGRIPELEQFERRAREAAPVRLNWPAPREISDAIDDAEFDLASIRRGQASYILAANAHAARSLRGRWYRWQGKWRPADGLIAADAAAIAALEEHRLRARPWSASALEQFAVCPYKFALHGIFKLRPREEAAPLEQLDPRTRGALFHTIQHRLYADLRAAHLLPVTAERLAEAIRHCDETLERVAAEFAEQLAPAMQRVWDSEIQDLRTDLRGWLQFVAANESDWEPVEFELPFETMLAEGILLHGRIDVVECQVSGGASRVTDHKTGKRPEKIPQWVGGGKHLQPLLYSLAAEQTLRRPVGAGRLLYATPRGGYALIEIRADQRARQVLAKWLADVDSMLSGGFLPPVPEKDACKICDYRLICGPYEEQRIKRKDPRDERLEPLFEIRGMA